jgi:D-sedoheptulose 7-phosphate isomerase
MIADDAVSIARSELLGAANTLAAAADCCSAAVARAAEVVTAGVRSGGKILLCGNGGSAADCQHLAAEFVNALRKEALRPAIAAVALTTDTSLLTASANDFGFDGVYARQVEALGRPGDVLLGLSTSGTSENVARAMHAARDLGLSTVALTGAGGGAVAELATVAIMVPSDAVQHVQEAHIAVGHAICLIVESSLYPHLMPGVS